MKMPYGAQRRDAAMMVSKFVALAANRLVSQNTRGKHIDTPVVATVSCYD